jgi:hypothetical protein
MTARVTNTAIVIPFEYFDASRWVKFTKIKPHPLPIAELLSRDNIRRSMPIMTIPTSKSKPTYFETGWKPKNKQQQTSQYSNAI